MMPLETDPEASSAGKKPPSLAEQAFATAKILLLAAALLGGIWLLDIFAT
ncbi:MAG: hypothetical protein KGM92_09765 [Acidobacteriota bacterium]|nr:hypothetical protein [Acidobacteriota bacterium]